MFRRAWFPFIVVAAVAGGASVGHAFEWIAKSDISVEEDATLVRDMPANDFVPIYAKATVAANDQLLIDVVYAKPLDVEWQYRRFDENTYEEKTPEYARQGFKLVSHQLYDYNGVTWHCAIWHKPK